MKKPLVILTGPTAVGKSDLSISLCKAINGSVISADSMQVYRGMDIGSAKITRAEMQDIPHYLIDILDPEEEFNISLFQKYAKEALDDIYKAGRIPVIVGGTGFYIQSVIYDVDFDEQEPSSVRAELEQFYKDFGAHALHEQLLSIDPVSYETIHENNVKRTIRALEYYRLSGKPISKHNEEAHEKESPFCFAYFVLNDERQTIYDRIDKRVDIMVQNGLIDEVKTLKDRGLNQSMVSMQGLGYKEILDYLDGKSSLEEALYIIKRDSRHFAKRQLTWFRREKEVIWINKNEYQHNEQLILDKMLEKLKEKEII